jgi:hypothetical protein
MTTDAITEATSDASTLVDGTAMAPAVAPVEEATRGQGVDHSIGQAVFTVILDPTEPLAATEAAKDEEPSYEPLGYNPFARGGRALRSHLANGGERDRVAGSLPDPSEMRRLREDVMALSLESLAECFAIPPMILSDIEAGTTGASPEQLTDPLGGFEWKQVLLVYELARVLEAQRRSEPESIGGNGLPDIY